MVALLVSSPRCFLQRQRSSCPLPSHATCRLTLPPAGPCRASRPRTPAARGMVSTGLGRPYPIAAPAIWADCRLLQGYRCGDAATISARTASCILSLRSRLFSLLPANRPPEGESGRRRWPYPRRSTQVDAAQHRLPFIWLTILPRARARVILRLQRCRAVLFCPPLLVLALPERGDTWNCVTNVEQRKGVSAVGVLAVCLRGRRRQGLLRRRAHRRLPPRAVGRVDLDCIGAHVDHLEDGLARAAAAAGRRPARRRSRQASSSVPEERGRSSQLRPSAAAEEEDAV